MNVTLSVIVAGGRNLLDELAEHPQQPGFKLPI
jgi:hypothetical protein